MRTLRLKASPHSNLNENKFKRFQFKGKNILKHQIKAEEFPYLLIQKEIFSFANGKVKNSIFIKTILLHQPETSSFYIPQNSYLLFFMY